MDKREANFKEIEETKPVVPGPVKSFVTLVDEALLAKQEKDNNGPGYYPLRPSASGYCARDLAFKLSAFKGYLEKKPEYRKPSLIRLLNLGHSVEYAALKDLKILPGYQVKYAQQVVDMFILKSGHRVEGSTDAVMWNEEHKCVLDVKSVGIRHYSAFGNSWDGLKRKYDDMNSLHKFDESAWYVKDMKAFMKEVGEDALVANISQINLYLGSSFMKERGVNYGVVYRYCKSNSELMEIRFDYSEWLFEAIKTKYQLIEDMVEARTPELVPRGSMLNGLACMWCEAGGPCKPNEVPYIPYSDAVPIGLDNDMASELLELEKMYFNKEKQTLLEQQILYKMEQQDVNKIKLGDITYQAVFLKSPKPHYELRKVAK